MAHMQLNSLEVNLEEGFKFMRSIHRVTLSLSAASRKIVATRSFFGYYVVVLFCKLIFPHAYSHQLS